MGYSLGNTTGVEIVEILYESGYKNLYLLMDWDKSSLDKYNIPEYLRVFIKGENDELIEVLLK